MRLVGDNPPNIATGQAYVTNLINTVMRGPDWGSTATFVVWDDWGGFYGHVDPPHVDENGYGIYGSLRWWSARTPAAATSITRRSASTRSSSSSRRLPARPAAGPTHRWTTRPPPRHPRGRTPARRPHRRLRFQSNATPTADSAAPSAAGTGIKAGWMTTVER